ncbi:MAG: hypothetical protein MJE68_09440 [Proteobacteria bacterium]|nr:hypothetical protein [Pseudomonadota bacterium]
MTDQLWVSAEVKQGSDNYAGFTYRFASHSRGYIWLTVGQSDKQQK